MQVEQEMRGSRPPPDAARYGSLLTTKAVRSWGPTGDAPKGHPFELRASVRRLERADLGLQRRQVQGTGEQQRTHARRLSKYGYEKRLAFHYYNSGPNAERSGTNPNMIEKF